MDDFREAFLLHASYYGAVLQKANDLYAQGGEALTQGLKVFDEECSNIQGAQSWAAAHSMEDDDAATLCSHYPYIGEMLVYLRFQPRDRIKWGEAALIGARRIRDQHEESAHLHKLALAYLDKGEINRAIEYLERAVAMNRAIHRPEYEAADLGALGLAYAALGEHREAVRFYGQALAIYRVIDARWGEGIYLSNLGESLRAIGKPRMAIRLHQRALAINREVHDRRSEGYTLGNLGRAYGTLGEHERALELFEENLDVAREMKDQQSEGYALFGSSLSLWEVRRCREARSRAERALKIFEQSEDVYAVKVREQLEQWREEHGGH